MSTVVLNANSSADMELIVTLAKKLSIKVLSITPKELEGIEDRKLLNLMLDARKEGLADTGETLTKLGITQ